MHASMRRSVFHITLKASHLDESQNRASLLAFAFTLTVCSATRRSPGRAEAAEDPVLVLSSGSAVISLPCTGFQVSGSPLFKLWHAPAAFMGSKAQGASRRNPSREGCASCDGGRFH